MDKNTNLIVIVLLVLIIGFGGGYFIRGNQIQNTGDGKQLGHDGYERDDGQYDAGARG